MSEALYAGYLRELEAEFPGLRIVQKRGDRLSTLIDRFLKVVTLGRQSTYLTQYTTVLGRTIFVPFDWERRDPRDRYVTLRHEAVHLRQARRYGLMPMGLLYGLPILPLGLAYGRARIEWEAYAETFRAVAEVYGPGRARDPALRAHVVRQFTGAAYGWMWPFPRQVNAWIDDVLSSLPSE